VNTVTEVTAVTACVVPSVTRPVLACLVVTKRVNTPVAAPVSNKVIVLAFESVADDGVTVAKSAFFTVTVTVSNSAAVTFAAESVTDIVYVLSPAAHVDVPVITEQVVLFDFASPADRVDADVGTTVITAACADAVPVELTPMATNNRTKAANAAVIFVKPFTMSSIYFVTKFSLRTFGTGTCLAREHPRRQLPSLPTGPLLTEFRTVQPRLS